MNIFRIKTADHHWTADALLRLATKPLRISGNVDLASSLQAKMNSLIYYLIWSLHSVHMS
ncbi:hypothetical protein DAPPUDRAFT_305983 [Daphnia pulex]|uniref:Uncharacterized protein n=1 Tax=Daphnia pulex TaxID=6669 RepID=E9GU77_DAPPU|nr:hypothetical protein DAPPUDRAFT_305983 [Daphnia pulex]|eukprot:EFX76986.1 hypothetical protein DAPPUDRAFT_305983 [Daphnia pulex]